MREYRFRHGLVQEVAYGSLTEARRRELHRAAGEALEELRAGRARGGLRAARAPLQPRRATPTRPSSTCSPPATPPGRSTPTGRRSRTTGARSTSWQADDPPGTRPPLQDRRSPTTSTSTSSPPTRRGRGAARSPAERPRERRHRPSVWSSPRSRSLSRFLPGHPVRHAGLVAHRRPVLRACSASSAGSTSTLDTAAELRVSERRPPLHGAPARRRGLVRRRAAHGARLRVRLERDPRARSSDRAPPRRRGRGDARRRRDARDPPSRAASRTSPTCSPSPQLFPWPAHVCERVGDRLARAAAPRHATAPSSSSSRTSGTRCSSPTTRWHGAPRQRRARSIVLFRHRRTSIDSGLATRRPRPPDRPAPLDRADARVRERGPGAGDVVRRLRLPTPRRSTTRSRPARFAHALDRARIARGAGGGGEPASDGGFLPPAMPGHSHRIGLDYDPARARELLADGGLPERPRAAGDHPRRAVDGHGRSRSQTQWRDGLSARDVTIVTLDPLDERPSPDLDPPATLLVPRLGRRLPGPGRLLRAGADGARGHTAALYRDDELLEAAQRVRGRRQRSRRAAPARPGARSHLAGASTSRCVPLCYPRSVTVAASVGARLLDDARCCPGTSATSSIRR